MVRRGKESLSDSSEDQGPSEVSSVKSKRRKTLDQPSNRSLLKSERSNNHLVKDASYQDINHTEPSKSRKERHERHSRIF